MDFVTLSNPRISIITRPRYSRKSSQTIETKQDGTCEQLNFWFQGHICLFLIVADVQVLNFAAFFRALSCPPTGGLNGETTPSPRGAVGVPPNPALQYVLCYRFVFFFYFFCFYHKSTILELLNLYQDSIYL
jgi:hypothetical protein